MTKKKSVKVIAEIGVNHNGSISLAKEMIRKAHDVGADYVKFQTFKPDNLVSKVAPVSKYQRVSYTSVSSQFELLSKLELPQQSFQELKEFSDIIGVGFLSSPFDVQDFHFLKNLELDYIKIPSGELTNFFLLEAISKESNRVILSTGMASLEEIREALNILFSNGSIDSSMITLLQCTSSYPAEPQDINLDVIRRYQDIFGCSVGFSDHSQSVLTPALSVGYGAEIIEKHFTYDVNAHGPDHKISLDPEQFSVMVEMVRFAETCHGESDKRPLSSENEARALARKSLVAKQRIRKGEVFTKDNVTAKRPSNGLSPMAFKDIEGQIAVKNIEAGELLKGPSIREDF